MIKLSCAILMAISVSMILEPDTHRKIFGLVLLGSTINIILLTCGRIEKSLPAFVGLAQRTELSNPVPQALILTAIVIGFGLLIFLSVLIKVLREQ